MSLSKKKVLALAGAIANLSFSVAVAGAATFAWYNSNKVTHSTNLSIKSASRNLIIDNFTILKYDDDLKKGVAFTNDASEFVLPDYDQYIKARNVYSNIVIRTELSFPNGLDTTTKAVEIDVRKLASSTLTDADGIRLLTSNVVQFQCIATSYTPFNSDTAIPIGVGISEDQGTYKDEEDAMYRTSIAYFASRKTPSTFISLMNNQPVDPENGNKITIVPELYNVGTIKKSIVYIECSYNEKLVDGFVEDHINSTDAIHNLVGDISNIDFYIRDFSTSTYGNNNTGKYIRMNDVGGSYSGQYLSSYITDSSQQILDGSKATGSETIGSSSGINTNNNQLNIGDYISNGKDTVYSTDAIDDASLTYDRANGTYRTDDNYYVGNNTTTDGIISNSSAENMSNTLAYNGTSAVVKSAAHSSMQMQYDTANSKFAYYGTSKNDISLYRFHENDIISASLTSLSITGPQGSDAIYSVGEYFSLRGITCIATYTKPNNDTFTLNVTSDCSYTTSGEGTLIPNKTVFTNIGSPKTINVTYTDRGTTKNGSFPITVLADVLEYIAITTQPTKTTYVKGDQFDTSGLVVTGHFATVGEIDVTSDCVFSIGGTYYANGQTLNISGNNLSVLVHYNGGATLGDFYADKTFKITIYNYNIDIDGTNEVITLNSSLTLDFSFNGDVDWSIIGTSGSLSFSSSDATVLTSSTTYTGSNFEIQNGTITVYGLAAGTSTLTATIHGTNIKDTCIIRVSDGSETYATYTITSTSAVTASGDVPSGSSAIYSSTYNQKYQLTAGNSMTLTLSGYKGYKITRILLSMKSNSDKGAGNFNAVVGSNTISSIATANFNDSSWHGSWSTNFVTVEPMITNDLTVQNGQNVVLTIAATVNSLYCESYTIYYEQGTLASVTSLAIKDGNTDITSGTKTVSNGTIPYVWTPTALVTYSDTTTSNNVTWSITSGTGLTINQSSGQISINSVSGSATIKATTTDLDSNGNPVEATFTLTWSNLTKTLSSIAISGQTVTFNVGDTFTIGNGVVTATYSDGTTANVTSSPNLTISSPDMSTSGSKTVTITYTEGGVTKETTYSITVSSTGPVYYIYQRITSTAGLAAGDIVLIGCAQYNVVAGAKSGDLLLPASVTIDNNGTIPFKCDGVEFTVGGTTGAWTFTSSSGQLYTQAAKKINYDSNGTGTWTVSISSGTATITSTNADCGSLQYNHNNGSGRFIPYTSTQSSIELYKKVETNVAPVVSLVSISVKTAPTKIAYTAGETFDPTGLEITLHYNDGSTTDVSYASNSSGFTFSPTTSYELTTTDTSITITYQGKTCAQPITVSSGGSQSDTVVISLDFTQNFYGITGTQGDQTLTGDGAGLVFGGGNGAKASAANPSSTTYILFGKTGAYLRNISAPSGYYISQIVFTYSNNTSEKVILSISYGATALTTPSNATNLAKAVKGATITLTNTNTSYSYFMLYVTNDNNCQIVNLTITYTKIST